MKGKVTINPEETSTGTYRAPIWVEYAINEIVAERTSETKKRVYANNIVSEILQKGLKHKKAAAIEAMKNEKK